MSTNGVKFQRAARMQFHSLTEKEQRQVMKALSSLEGIPPAQWPPGKVGALRVEAPLYLLRVSKEWRAFISPAKDNGIDVHFVMHKDTIRHLGGHEAATGEPA